MNIDNLTIAEAKQIAEMFGRTVAATPSHPYQIGKNYAIRTVTHIYTGHLVAVYPGELVLDKCAWIADAGRWMHFCQHGPVTDSAEVEPMGDGIVVSRGAIGDAKIVTWELPESQK